MKKINVPIKRIFVYHQEAENFDEKERSEQLGRLEESFSDFFNYTGAGLQLKPEISEKYYLTYNDTKLAYSRLIESYVTASTIEERVQA